MSIILEYSFNFVHGLDSYRIFWLNVLRPSMTINYYYKNKNWLQFLFIVKAAVLKQQISKSYLQILSTEASDQIYFS